MTFLTSVHEKSNLTMIYVSTSDQKSLYAIVWHNGSYEVYDGVEKVETGITPNKETAIGQAMLALFDLV